MSGFCYNDGCVNDAKKQCSGCKMATYCSTVCQEVHWKGGHKKECEMNRIIRESEDNEKEKAKKKPQVKPRKTHCTGCNEKFMEDYCEIDQECPDCGYITCESCSCHNSRGSCYCDNGNFGYLYCDREPRDYHMGKSGMYRGDYHPSKEAGYDLNKEDVPEAFTKDPEPCNNCGKQFHLLEN